MTLAMPLTIELPSQSADCVQRRRWAVIGLDAAVISQNVFQSGPSNASCPATHMRHGGAVGWLHGSVLVRRPRFSVGTFLWPLQGCEMPHAGHESSFHSGNTLDEIFGMFGFDKFVMLALYDRDGHMDIGQVARRIVGFRFHDPTDRFGKCVELVRHGRQLGVVLGELED